MKKSKNFNNNNKYDNRFNLLKKMMTIHLMRALQIWKTWARGLKKRNRKKNNSRKSA